MVPRFERDPSLGAGACRTQLVAASAQNIAGQQDAFIDMAMKKNGLPFGRPFCIRRRLSSGRVAAVPVIESEAALPQRSADCGYCNLPVRHAPGEVLYYLVALARIQLLHRAPVVRRQEWQ